ncbi:nitrogen regulation protein NR(II) [Acidipila sp. EB88]|uniref:two-component system sensor histidine kinase NtrB n=1 Tax=Acidipila sp. EB88 TaxID=2305226 RepID=UPI000F6041C6|nr:ATP-binding protein [Acidipila sp. EB88]
MRLKTKLVAAVTGLVFLLVSATSWLYLSRSMRQYIDQSYSSTDIIAHQVLFATRQAIEQGVLRGTIAPSLPADQVAATLSRDPALNALMDSIISYSPTTYDITVADSSNMALVSTDPLVTGHKLAWRPDYGRLRYRSPIKILQIVFGKPRVYDLPLMLERNSHPFASVHIGMRTSFLLQVFRPTLLSAVSYTAAALLISLLAAAVVASLALAPLEQISRRLDVLNAEAADAADTPADRVDTLLRVSSKIERIGERMRNTEEVFSALKENLDQILSNLQDGMMLFTRDSRAVLVSSSVERFLGIEREQMLGAHAIQIFSRSTRLGRMVRDAFQNRTSIPQAEIEIESGRRIQIALEIIQDERESLGALLTLHDLESVREIESELELSRRLSAIGRLTGGVGHEVKNPINAIVVHLELMRNKLTNPDGGSDSPAMRHLDVIQSEIQRLDRVVQTLIDFSRPVELKLQDEDLRGITSNVLRLASAEFSSQDIQLETVLPQRAVMVKVDADMLRQAILNIVLNGTQAMPDGGTLRISLTEEARFAVLTISDTGSGIASEVLPRIFDLYFTTKRDGSGIGLAMCYRIVQLHSGVIEVESEPGRGTQFRLQLPLSHSNERDTKSASQPATALRQESE